MNNYKLNTPVLFLIFNRPELTKKVFEIIREAKPPKLFIAADGPRLNNPDDIEKCKKARNIINQIDWDCELYTLFREENLGCKKAVASGITWFFNNVENGIVLEDDCLPHISFFRFTEELLEKFKDEEKIMMISGYNACNEWAPESYSYIYSIYGSIHGWATWKRAWKYFDVSMNGWSKIENQNIIKTYIDDKKQWKSRKIIFDDTYSGKIDTWDYIWTFTRFLRSGLAIIPSRNLVKNIGWGKDATHTTMKIPKGMATDFHEMIFPLKSNNLIIIDRDFDKQLSELNDIKMVKRIIVKTIRFLGLEKILLSIKQKLIL